MKQVVFDRSRNEALQKCPRKRFLEYEYPSSDGPTFGLTRKAHAVPLLTGSEVHRGNEFILCGYGEDAAIFNALSHYDEAVKDGLDEVREDNPATQWVVKVQRALIEALARGWNRYVWPRIEAEFEIIAVEQEERATFDYTEETEAVLMARTDTILRRKVDQRYFVRNFKTISEAKDYKIEGFRYDTQTISEVLAVEQRLGHEVDGVIFDFLVKGPKKVEFPKGSGVWHNASPLIWCYYNESQSDVDMPAVAARWEYSCVFEHTMGGGKRCPGGRNHTLGKGWERKLVTDVFANGILDWFQWLDENEPQLVLDQFVSLPPIMRTPFDVETWKRSVVHEEVETAWKAETCRNAIREEGLIESLPILDNLFPKHTHNSNCLFPTKCQMFEICWGTLSAVDDPLESELYVPRTANHPEGSAE